MRAISSNTGRLLVVFAVFFCLLVVGFHTQIDRYAVYAMEDITYAHDPSAARAVAYGNAHLDARNPALYDIDRAAAFFMDAAIKDPTTPYVFHQLARISFLRGNFQTALAQIDTQISLHGESEPNSYYIRGLIEGYTGQYAASQADYAHYLQFDSYDWAALNDYAWVLLKGGRFQDAANITMQGLRYYPDNPWLLNSNATALFELGAATAALPVAQAAEKQAQSLTEQQWLEAYPGNDPKIAEEGIATFKQATLDNMHTIQAALASSTVQSRGL